MDISERTPRAGEASRSSGSTTPLRVGVVEDQPLFNGMLGDLIDKHPRTRLVGRATTVAHARKLFLPGTVDVLTMDIELPDGNGVSLGVSLKRQAPELGIVLLSAYDLMDMLLEMPEDTRGGWSYLSKKSALTSETLFAAIEASARGDSMLDPELMAHAAPRTDSVLLRLTDRQYAVLQLLAQGLSNQGIATRLGIAEKSVQNHLTSIYSILGVPADSAKNPRVLAALTLLVETGRDN